MALIHILDNQKDTILGTLDVGQYYDDRKVSTTDNLDTFDFTALDHFDLLQKRNRLLLQGVDGSFNEYIIEYAEQTSRKEKVIRSNASFIDLRKAKAIEPQTLQGATASTAASTALFGTEWKVGQIGFSRIRTIKVDEHTNPYSLLKTLASTFELELRFRVEIINENKIVRYVDLLESESNFDGKEVAFGKDIVGLRRTEDSHNIVTALLGVGPKKEDGTRTSVFVEDKDALQRWGRNGQHLIEVYEPESEDADMTEARLKTLTENALKKRIDSIVEYECSATVTEHIHGNSHERIRLYHTIRVKDDGYTPPLYLEARVKELTEQPSTGKILDFKLGNYTEYSKEDLEAQVASLRKKLDSQLAQLIQITVTSTAGSAFKNGTGSTTLEAITVRNGKEIDVNGMFRYNWAKYDKDGNLVAELIDKTKSIVVNASDITEQATYVVNILTDDVFSVGQFTITNVNDGKDGKDGKDGYTPIKGVDYFDGEDGQSGRDGSSSYLWVKYSTDANGNPMSDSPSGAQYIGVATTTTASAPSNYTAYKWTLIKGTDGVPGEAGADGKTSYLHIKYSNDGGQTFTANNGETVGAWIGTYVDFNSTDSSSVSSYTWNKVKGEKGDQGPKGENGYTPIKGVDYFDGIDGQDGSSSYLWVKYSVSSTGNPMTDSPVGASFIGVATTTTPSAPTSYTAYKWTLIKGDQGVKGETGTDGKTSYLHIKYSNDGGKTFTANNGETIGDWIGTYVDFNSADSNSVSSYTWNKVKGDKGDIGPKGDTGIGISSITEYYLATNLASGVTTSTGGWTTSVQTITSSKKYLWNYEKVTYTDNQVVNTAPVIIGTYGEKGDTGSTGAPGRSIDTITEYYLATSVSSGVTRSTSGWTTTMQAVTSSKKYLWNYEVITYKNPTSTEYVEPVIIGAYGDKGDQGPQGATGDRGPQGPAGTSVSGITEYYLATSASSGVMTSTSGWSTGMQSMTTTNKYLWNYEKITFSDGSSSNTIPVIIGVYGNTGSTGATGRSITGVTEYYLATSAATGVTRSTSGWTTSMQATTTTNRYLWNYEVISWSSAPTTTYVEPIIIGVHGATGETGPQGPKGDTGDRGLQGIQGPKGDQGIQGPKGADGLHSYTHIAYANNSTGTSGFSVSDSAGKTYIGMYVDNSPTDSQTPSMYKWTLIKGADGAQGIQGPKGADGQTPYFHTAWANNSTGTSGFSTTVSAGKLYIGTYTDFVSADSNDPSKYNWTLIKGDKGDKGDTGQQGPQGVQGPKGDNGQTLYTWVKYADTPTSGMSDSPTGKTYIGLAYNKTTATESSTYSDYSWSLIKGADGARGPAGTNGTTTYTWIKYADDENGNGMANSPDGKRYLGLAYNKTTATESSNASDYTWSPLYDNVVVGGRNYFSLARFKELAHEAWVVRAYVYRFTLEPNTEYTVSSNVPDNEGNTSYTNVYFNSSGTAESGVWIGRPITKKSDVDGNLYIAIPTGRPHTEDLRNGKYWVQLEKGNVATDWTPAPEDVQGEIDKKPDKARLIAEINASGETVKIQGSKIDITGQVTFNSLDSGVKADINAGKTASTTIGSKAGTWDRAGNFTADGKLATSKLSGTVADNQIANSSKWNTASTDTSRWKVSGKTTINGGQIEADSVKALQIDVANLWADTAFISKLNAHTFNAVKITAGSIKGVTLEGSTFKANGSDSAGNSVSMSLFKDGLNFDAHSATTTEYLYHTYYTAEGILAQGRRASDFEIRSSYTRITGALNVGDWIQTSFIRAPWGGGIDFEGDAKFLNKVTIGGMLVVNGWTQLNAGLEVNGKLNVNNTEARINSNGDTVSTSLGGQFTDPDTGVKRALKYNGGVAGDFLRVNSNTANLNAIETTGKIQINGEGLEIVWSGRTPYLDFSNDSTSDFDVRLILQNNDQLEVVGGDLKAKVVAPSKAEYKEDIEDYTKSALEVISSVKAKSYKYKNSKSGETTLGVIAEEAPDEILTHYGDSVDLYSMITLTWKAIQELKDEVEFLKKRMR